MNKNIRLLVEGFFDDDIFNVDDDIKSDLEDLGRYYEYTVGDIFYQNKKPYAVCCGEPKQFNDNNSRFCLLNDYKTNMFWCTYTKVIKKLKIYNKFDCFCLNTFNDFQHIDEDGYGNTQIIKNNYDISEFPAFEYCLNLGDNVYLPAIDELQVMYLNKNKLGKYKKLKIDFLLSSTQYSAMCAYGLNPFDYDVTALYKDNINNVLPFFHIT